MELCWSAGVLGFCTHKSVAKQKRSNCVGGRPYNDELASRLFFVPFQLPICLGMVSGCSQLLCTEMCKECDKEPTLYCLALSVKI